MSNDLSTKRLKILYVTITLSNRWGGGETAIAKDTIDALKSKNYEVKSCYYEPFNNNLFQHIIAGYRQIFNKNDFYKYSYSYYSKIIKEFNPDLIISQYDYDSSIIKAATDNNKKILVYCHIWWPVCPKNTLFSWDKKICGGFLNKNCGSCLNNSNITTTSKNRAFAKIFKPLLNINNKKIRKKMTERTAFLNNKNVKMVVYSAHMKSVFSSNRLSTSNMEIIPNGVQCKNSNCEEKKGKKIVCYYGGANELKGFNIFLKLAEEIKQILPEVEFIATGGGLSKMKSDFVKFIGEISREDVNSLMMKSICTVVPSIWDEPFGLVAIESMALCTPVVAFDTGMFREIIDDGVSGFLVPTGDIGVMKSKIISIVTNDDLLKSMMKESKMKVCRNFSEKLRIAKLISAINSFIEI